MNTLSVMSDTDASTIVNPPCTPPPTPEEAFVETVEHDQTEIEFTPSPPLPLPLPMLVPLLPFHALLTGFVVVLSPSTLSSTSIPLLPSPGPRRLAYWCEALFAHMGAALIALVWICFALGDIYGQGVGLAFALTVMTRVAWAWRVAFSYAATDAEVGPLGENDWESVKLVLKGSDWYKAGQCAKVRIRGEVADICFDDGDEDEVKVGSSIETELLEFASQM